jgi:hypothetical protein
MRWTYSEVNALPSDVYDVLVEEIVAKRIT